MELLTVKVELAREFVFVVMGRGRCTRSRLLLNHVWERNDSRRAALINRGPRNEDDVAAWAGEVHQGRFYRATV